MRRFHASAWIAGMVLAWQAALPGAPPRQPAVRPGQFPPPRDVRPGQQPTFRVQIDLVQVDVLTTDRDGRFVTDLRQDEFELLEDGKPQRVATFQLVDVPIKAAADASAFLLQPQDVRNNAGDLTGRVYLIVLDDVRTPFEKSGYGRRVATHFVQQYMQPGDTGAVVFTSGRRNASQEFTADRQRLLAAIDKFSGRVGDPATEGAPVAPGVNTAGGIGDAVALTAAAAAARANTQSAEISSIRTIVTTLAALAQGLGARPGGGRKACVYLGPGFPMALASGERPTSPAEYRDLVAAANRANVTFYTIDPTGLSTLAEAGGAGSQPGAIDAVEGQNALELSHEGLRFLAADTGGFSVANSNNFDRAFERVRRETSSYYLLGYYPAGQKEGSTHRIEVRVRRPGVAVRARAGYGIPRSSARPSTTLKTRNVPAALLPALDSPLAATGVRISAAAAVFNGGPKTPRWASVVIEIDGRDLDTSGKGGADVAVIALDELQSVKGHDVRHVDLALDAGGLARVREAGLRVQARVPLEGRAKTLRVAVADSGTPRVGSLSFDLDVPEFEKDPISMSGLLLTDSRATRVPTTNTDEEFRKVLGAPVTTRREFQAGDAISWVTEVYQAGATTDVSVTTVIEGGDRRQVLRREEHHAPSEPRGPRGGIQVAGQARLADLPPGPYVLRVEARRAGTPAPVVREIPFLVRN